MVYQKLECFPPRKKCNFCHTNEVNELDYGEIASLQGLHVHYFCVLLSSSIVQKGNDRNGILGFLPKDIRNELARGKNLLCSYCGLRNATIKCAANNCKYIFHLPCGLKKGSIHQFYGGFHSFCYKHRPRQNISNQLRKNALNCVLCLNDLNENDKVIWPSCCRPSHSLFHQRCVQKTALMSGSYFLKCPLCNDNSIFVSTTKRLGIYVPDRDPAWEREGAFNDLLDRRISCEKGPNCQCPRGPEFSRTRTQWALERCQTCGGSGIHLACSNIWQSGSNYHINWVCEACTPTIPSNAQSDSSSSENNMEIEENHHNNSESSLSSEPHMNAEPSLNRLEPELSRLSPQPASPFQPSDFLRSDLIIISDSDDNVSIYEISSTDSHDQQDETDEDIIQSQKRKILEVIVIE